MKKIQPDDAPSPKGHYSPAVVHNGLVFVSGQLPRNPVSSEIETVVIERRFAAD